MKARTNSAAHANAWACAPLQGTGIGLRSPHIAEVLQFKPDVPWFELLIDNHFAPGGLIRAQTMAVREHYPVTFHCVGMSLGSTDPLDKDYLRQLKALNDQYQPAWISDHLCFTSHARRHYHDLLPLPFNEAVMRHLIDRIQQVQDYLGQRILVENVSSYLTYTVSDSSEAEFIAELVERADCDLLLDINNIHVNAVNHGLDAREYVDRMPAARIREMHLAGHEVREGYLIDSHSRPVSEPVWSLYRHAIQRCPQVPVLVEWDNDIPPLSTLIQEAQRAETLRAAATRKTHHVHASDRLQPAAT